MTDELAHSSWGASSAHRWMSCPGAIRMSQDIPRTTSRYAQEGSCAHELAHMWLSSGPDRSILLDHALASKYPDVEITEEMYEAVQLYVDTIRTDIATLGGTFRSEVRFDLSEVCEGLWGTADGVLTPEDLLIVYDFKYGAGHRVEVKDNPQLKYYALGALLESNGRAKRVDICIVQPRTYHPDGPVRRYSMHAVDLLEFRADLIEAVVRTRNPDAPLVPGDHCLFCPAEGVCLALKERTQELARIDFAHLNRGPPPPATMTIEEISDVLWNADMVENWLTAVRRHAQTLMEMGIEVPNHKLVPKRPQRKWKHEYGSEEVVCRLLAHYPGLDENALFKAELRSPAQIESLLKAQKADLTEFKNLWDKVSSGSKIARNTDAQPGVAPLDGHEFQALVDDTSGAQKQESH